MYYFKVLISLLMAIAAINPLSCHAMFEDHNLDVSHPTWLNTFARRAKQLPFKTSDPKAYEQDKEKNGSEPAPAYLLEKTRRALKSMGVKNADTVPIHLFKKDYKAVTDDGYITLGEATSTGIWLSDVYCETLATLTQYGKQRYTAKNRHTSYHEAAHFALQHTAESKQLFIDHSAELKPYDVLIENENKNRSQLEEKWERELQDCSKRWWCNYSKAQSIYQEIMDNYANCRALYNQRTAIADKYKPMSHSMHFHHEQEADELAVRMMCKDGYAHDVSLLTKICVSNESQKDDYYAYKQCTVIKNAFKKWQEQQSKKQDTLRDLCFAIGR